MWFHRGKSRSCPDSECDVEVHPDSQSGVQRQRTVTHGQLDSDDGSLVRSSGKFSALTTDSEDEVEHGVVHVTPESTV